MVRKHDEAAAKKRAAEGSLGPGMSDSAESSNPGVWTQEMEDAFPRNQAAATKKEEEEKEEQECLRQEVEGEREQAQ
eukprot:13182333-Alexandrium_andersonii.AAC.1